MATISNELKQAIQREVAAFAVTYGVYQQVYNK